MLNKFGFICSLIAVAILFTLIGFLVKNFPFISWNKAVSIAEVANLILTLSIGVLLPIIILKSIDNIRSQKGELIEDLKNLLREVKKVKDKIDECYGAGLISQVDKNIINHNFEYADKQSYNLKIYLEDLFQDSSDSIFKEIENTFKSYWDAIADGSLMGSYATAINPGLYSEQARLFSIFEQSIRKAIFRIHRI